ncbi:MAG: PIN domain-containing protein [Planctomycetales bacterium]|nr:PIN domain-containing protein [Planctomycetales bacterium]
MCVVIVPDANLLLYAYNTGSPFHRVAASWWEACLSGSEPVGLAHPVVFSFLRTSTSTRAFLNPFTLQEATERISSWLDRRVTRVISPGHGHVQHVIELLDVAGTAGGNLVADAQIAALAIAHKATLHTADHDFLRFPGLKAHFPLSTR